MPATAPSTRFFLLPLLLLGLAALPLAACGGGSTGAAAGQGLVLVSFLQGGVDNVPINDVLEFTFSEAVDPATITAGSIQIRQGPEFGSTADGTFDVVGATVYFRPVLPAFCDLSDAGLQPGTAYRVTIVGSPEEFAIRNTSGQPLRSTLVAEFETLPDSAEGLLRDQIPATPPAVLSTSPASGDAAVSVDSVIQIEVRLSENIDPCSVNESTVLLKIYEVGDPDLLSSVDAPNGNKSGFDPATDSAPGDPFTWGASNATSVVPPQTVPATLALEQDFDDTRLVIRPTFGELPDNALVVAELTFGIVDFGGSPLPPTIFSFTTENLPPRSTTTAISFDGDVPIDMDLTTADVNTVRAPDRAQGFLLFAGDGDNGSDQVNPSYPASIDPADCTFRPNLGGRDDFDPDVDAILDTGASPNTCLNQTDGSVAVVWEFRTFRIRQGRSVRIIGVNPAILLVQGDMTIEAGGMLLARGDGLGGSLRGRGANGSGGTAAGGAGAAGAGDGGRSFSPSFNADHGEDGFSGIGSPDYDPAMAPGGSGNGGLGAGEGGTSISDSTSSSSSTAISQAGGGGGHATEGADAATSLGNNGFTARGPIRGEGGGVYPTSGDIDRLITPSAGSGGGGAGDTNSSSSSGDLSGGGGGAGGGFLDISCGGDIRVFGTIDAAGSNGGNGSGWTSGTNVFAATGGGGGGSGGGVRLLTPNDIDLDGGTITAAGGLGGSSGAFSSQPGGVGGVGRIVLEDGDSVISGLFTATLLPGEGQTGFFRGAFDATRFQGGGLSSEAVTEPFFLGPVSAITFEVPVQADFVVQVPEGAGRGPDGTAILYEAQGYPLLPDGQPDLGAGTGWYTVGYFRNSGAPVPQWVPGVIPADVPVSSLGVGISNLDGNSQFLQVRLSFFLPPTLGPFDPGPLVDRLDVRFTHGQ